jgi:hypothetical protein
MHIFWLFGFPLIKMEIRSSGGAYPPPIASFVAKKLIILPFQEDVKDMSI